MEKRIAAEREFFTPNELNRRSGISATRIREAMRRGDLVAYRVGHWNRATWADFLTWLRSHRVRPQPDARAHASGVVERRIEKEHGAEPSRLGA